MTHSVQHWIEYALVVLLKRIVLLLPLKTVQRLGAVLGGIGYHMSSRRRSIALDNLAHAFPEKTPPELVKIAQGAFRNYGIALMELLWFPRLTTERMARLLKPRNIELMTRRAQEGRGLVMLAGHFGNWELIALGMACLAQTSFAIIVQTQNNKLVDRLINTHRCLSGNRVVPMGMSVREIIRTLQQGGVVAIAPDQSGPSGGVFVEFFGRMVATHQGPAVFALRTRAPLQIGFIIRQEDGSYEVVLEEIPFDDLTDASEASIVELTRRHTARLEQQIRQYPDHWLWMHRRWKHTLEKTSLPHAHSMEHDASTARPA